nr:hypothetical protein [Tanacetum cinerariifolium]
LEQATGVLHAARFQGRWRSLLTSLHLSTLYEPLRDSQPTITTFLDELHASQVRWTKELHLTKTQGKNYLAPYLLVVLAVGRQTSGWLNARCRSAYQPVISTLFSASPMAHYKFSDVIATLKSSAGEFGNNNSFRHAAALSYYTIFSLPPLLLIVITTASAVYGGEALTGQIYGQLKGLVGADAAAFLQESIAKFTLQQKGGLATAVGVGTLIFAATTFFVT